MDETIKRINELAAKARTPEGLTLQEEAERDMLRQKYIKSFRENMRATLETITIVEEDGSHTPLKKMHKEQGN